MKSEPTLIVGGIGTFLMSCLTAWFVFHANDYTPEQQGALTAVVTALVALVGIIATVLTRQSVYSPDTVARMRETARQVGEKGEVLQGEPKPTVYDPDGDGRINP